MAKDVNATYSHVALDYDKVMGNAEEEEERCKEQNQKKDAQETKQVEEEEKYEPPHPVPAGIIAVHFSPLYSNLRCFSKSCKSLCLKRWEWSLRKQPIFCSVRVPRYNYRQKLKRLYDTDCRLYIQALSKLKEQQKDNPMFLFLVDGHPLRPYLTFLINKLEEAKKKEEEEKEKAKEFAFSLVAEYNDLEEPFIEETPSEETKANSAEATETRAHSGSGSENSGASMTTYVVLYDYNGENAGEMSVKVCA